MKKITKIYFDENEIENLVYFLEIQCQGIKCSECPYNIHDYYKGQPITKCFATLVSEILDKGGYHNEQSKDR